MPTTRPTAPTGPTPRFTNLADRLYSPILLVSGAGRILYLNPAAASVFGLAADRMVGNRVEDAVHPDDRRTVRQTHRAVVGNMPTARPGVVRVRLNPSGDWRLFEYTAENLLDDADVGSILVSIVDATASHEHTRALAELAFRDALTGFANRTKVVDDASHVVAAGRPVTIGLVSIDRLSLAEDSLGQQVAEAMIRAVGKRMRSATPASAMIARLEGGTFAFVLAGSAARHATTVGWRIVERVRAPLFVGQRELLPSVSVGLASSEPAGTVESMLWDAGLALHRAQARGGHRLETFTNGLREQVVSRLEMEADLRRAVAEGALALAFQPIVRLTDRSIAGSEALLRWNRPRGDVGPAEFVPVAETSGLIVPIGEWVVDEAARHAAAAPGGRVSVNLSTRQLALPNLPRILDELVRRHANPDAVQFEITETLLIEEWEYTAGVLAEIRRLGYRVGLDDFGTGYSSLGYLRKLPIDFLKVDRSLVADVDTNRQAREIVGAVIKMAEALDLEVVAEGVEREKQATVLLDLGAGKAQGHLFGSPSRPDW